MNNKDYYEILGVKKNATEQEIKSAFRKLSLQWHPDRQQGKSDAEKKHAEEMFKDISAAYDTLSDKDKRAKYDMYGADEYGNMHQSDSMDMDDFMARHADMFSSMFGDHFNPFDESDFFRKAEDKYKNPREDGADLLKRVDLTFKESVFGCSKEFEINTEKECTKCHGTGIDGKANIETCEYCHGTGMFRQQTRTPFGVSIVQSVCPHCHGMGSKAHPCDLCGGHKRLSTTAKISVKIPPGVRNGQRLRVTGKGQCGVAGGKNGDLYVGMTVAPSPLYERGEGMDIILRSYPISPLVATLGGKVDIPSLNGFKKLEIPAGTLSGQVFKIPKQGIAGKGDFIVEVKISPLENLTSDQQKALKDIMKSLSEKNVAELDKVKQFANSFYS